MKSMSHNQNLLHEITRN